MLIHFTGKISILTTWFCRNTSSVPIDVLFIESLFGKTAIQTKIEFVKTGHGKTNKVTKQEMKDMKDELQSANIIAWSGSIELLF